MSKLSFRARQLDAYKSMHVYHSEELPDVADVAAINRAVPQMPTGMEKEEESVSKVCRKIITIFGRHIGFIGALDFWPFLFIEFLQYLSSSKLRGQRV